MNLTYNIEKNNFVYKLYDLTPEEIAIVENFKTGKNIVSSGNYLNITRKKETQKLN